jgi:carboxyl-terminal processing protease
VNKFVKYSLTVLVAVVLLLGSFSGGFVVGHYLPFTGSAPALAAPGTSVSPSAGQTATPADLQKLFAPFWETWQIVHDQYVDQPVDNVNLMRGAIRGMLESLGDQHTSYMDPQEYKDANASLEGAYEGIGAYVDTTGDYLTIISPINGSPAEKAGIQTGDQIIAIDGQDMTGINPEIVRQKVLGPAGSTVHLTILRKGEDKPLEFDIVRAKIEIPSVEGKMLDNNIAYVKINTFGATTTSELRSTLKDLMAKKPQGMIIDLRNNGGGYLNTAIEVGSQFIPKGVILYEQYGDGRRETYNAQPGGLATDIPLVVLINKGTASASEILAGAIQDYGRGKLVGDVSYGKGSVQNWIQLQDDQGAVRVTIAKWLTPKERTIDKIGLTPDYKVQLTEDDAKANRDPQLDKAIELLTNNNPTSSQ